MRRETLGRSLVPDLRSALRHLYDQVELRRSPLIDLLGVAHRKEPHIALRRLLTEAVEALKPDPAVPPQSRAWSTYHILSQRYVEQLTQREVATDLGLSVRQLQRQESRALRVLADLLWTRHTLGGPSRTREAASSHTHGPDTGLDGSLLTREQEMAWLRQSVPSELVDASQVIRSALNVVETLMESLGVHVECAFPDALPPLAAQRGPIRQALLIVLTAAINSVPGGQVRITAQVQRWGEGIGIRAVRRRAIPSAGAKAHLSHLEVAQQLVALSGGSLEVIADDSGPEPLVARLNLPAAEQVPVLVVDDNDDAQRLFEHYLANTRYRFIGARNAEELVASVGRQTPEVIVLDVMLPGVDGWELLGRLRAHPSSCDVPIIVCTILPQEQLALSLGAAAFLSKPVSRSAFLSALDQQLALAEKESRSTSR